MGSDVSPHIINLPCFHDHRGSLTVVEGDKEFPFPVKRAYWICGVPEGETRGGHAHASQQRLLIAVAGKFTITLDDGKEERSFLLDSPSEGLYIPSMIWNTLSAFSSDAVCLVLASAPYDDLDYIRDYNQFAKLKKQEDLNREK